MSNQNSPTTRRVTSRQWQNMISEALDQSERQTLYAQLRDKRIVIDDSGVKEPRERLTAYEWAMRLRSVSDEERQKLRAAEASGEIEVLEPHDPNRWMEHARKREEALRARAEKEAAQREQNAS